MTKRPATTINQAIRQHIGEDRRHQGQADYHLHLFSELSQSERAQRLLKDHLIVPRNDIDRHIVRMVEQARPPALRTFDQIPMRTGDLLRQIKLIAPYLHDKTVVFVGDADCSSLLLGFLGRFDNLCPAHMLVIDFDERLLANMRRFANQHGFGKLLETRCYNVFDAVPRDLVGRYDWFYTNPPYGCRNQGASAQLFINRGCEITGIGGSGCIILPDDRSRPWSHEAMALTQQFLGTHGWTVAEKLRQLHQYHLDDDHDLASTLIMVEHATYGDAPPMHYTGRSVTFDEMPMFYGRTVEPPYPHHVTQDGSFDYDWSASGAPHDDI
jgi:N4-bis(aminopropyl)spermidine synthase